MYRFYLFDTTILVHSTDRFPLLKNRKSKDVRANVVQGVIKGEGQGKLKVKGHLPLRISFLLKLEEGWGGLLHHVKLFPRFSLSFSLADSKQMSARSPEHRLGRDANSRSRVLIHMKRKHPCSLHPQPGTRKI